jgi:PKD repeat protein
MVRNRNLRSLPVLVLAAAVLSCTEQPTTAPDISPQMAKAVPLAPIADPGGPYTGTTGTAVAFDGRGSSDPDGPASKLTYSWTFANGSTGTGPTPTHTYTSGGVYTVTLQVKDRSDLLSSPVSTTVTIELSNQAPVANAGGAYSGTPGVPIVFDGWASSDPDGDEPLTYAWTFGDGGTATDVSPSHIYASGGNYIVTLTVTDAKGKPSAPVATTASVSSNGSPITLLADGFSRFSSDGWGNADVGGAYRLDPRSSSAKFTIDGSRGVIELHGTQPLKAVGSGLDTYGLDVDGLISVSADRAPDAPGEYHLIRVYARRNDRDSFGHNLYRFRLRIFGSGTMDVRIEKEIGSATGTVATSLTGNQPLNLTFSPGAKYWIRWEATGTSPATTLRVRVWLDGTPEPATTWHAAVVHDEPRLDVSGTSGIRINAPDNGQINFPIRFFVDDFLYRQRS